MARRRRKKTTTISQRAVGLATYALPSPVQHILQRQSIAFPMFVALLVALASGLVFVNWENGVPHLSINQQKAAEAKHLAAIRLEQFEQRHPSASLGLSGVLEAYNSVGQPGQPTSWGQNQTQMQYPNQPTPYSNQSQYQNQAAQYPNSSSYPNTYHAPNQTSQYPNQYAQANGGWSSSPAPYAPAAQPVQSPSGYPTQATSQYPYQQTSQYPNHQYQNQPYSGQPYTSPASPYPNQSTQHQNHPTQYPNQNYSNQNYSGQSYSGQSYPSQGYPSQNLQTSGGWNTSPAPAQQANPYQPASPVARLPSTYSAR